MADERAKVLKPKPEAAVKRLNLNREAGLLRIREEILPPFLHPVIQEAPFDWVLVEEANPSSQNRDAK